MSCHLFYCHFQFPHSSPPLHIVLVFLRYIKGFTGMLSRWPGVCSHRVQWSEVIWTQWLVFNFHHSPSPAGPRLSVGSTSLRLDVYSSGMTGSVTRKHVGPEQDRAGWRCVCVYFSRFGLCFVGCMLFVNVRKKSEIPLCGCGCCGFVFFWQCPKSFLLQSDHHAVKRFVFYLEQKDICRPAPTAVTNRVLTIIDDFTHVFTH